MCIKYKSDKVAQWVYVILANRCTAKNDSAAGVEDTEPGENDPETGREL